MGFSHPLTVLVLVSDPLARRGLASLLDDDELFRVVIKSTTPNISEHDITSADLLLWDLGWDGSALDEGELWEHIAAFVEAGLPVLLLVPDAETAAGLLRIGARGVLLRRADRRQLWAAVHGVAAGLQVVDPLLVQQTPAPLPSLTEPLTPREREVLLLLAEGLTNRAIGHRLGISEHTAKFHVQALLGKLGAASRTEAVVQATRLGLLTL